MAMYDELRHVYANWSQTKIDYWQDAARYARSFTEGFGEYLGAPREYVESDRTTKRPYVQLCKIVKVDGEDDDLQPTNWLDALTREEDGFFEFGIRLVLERAVNSYPKTAFGFSVGFFPKENHCELRVAEKTFRLEMTNDSTRVPVYDHMNEWLNRWLQAKPWEIDRKRQIGFIHSEVD
jgi:hypothetical protein